jgi:pSer/pThr/pTyr-binding forkhead associated (FHA) protein
MTGLFLMVLRYLFLVLFYVLIIWLFWNLIRELRTMGRQVANGEFEGAGGEQPELATSPRLVLLEGGERRVIRVGATTRIGRGPDNEVVLPRADVWECHARILLRHGQYWLEDLSPDGDTRLNGLPVDGPTVLAHGDRVEVGGATLLFERWPRAARAGTA